MSVHLLAYKRQRIARERLGPAHLPASTVATHLRLLISAGWAQAEIADYTGVGRRTLHSILNNERPLVTRYTTEALLALKPDDAPGRISPLGTQRRIQGLAAIGWPVSHTAHDAGLHPQFLRDVLRGQYRRIPRDKAAAVERVCRARFLTPGPSRAARTIAARHGWVPVTAWPDIDDPECQPDVTGAAA